MGLEKLENSSLWLLLWMTKEAQSPSTVWKRASQTIYKYFWVNFPSRLTRVQQMTEKKVCSIKSTEWMLLISDDGKGQERWPERSGRFHKSFVSLKDSVLQVIYQSQNGEGTHTHKQVWYSPCWVHPLGSEERDREREKVGFVIDVSLDNNNSNSTAIQGHAQISSHGAIKIHPLY